MKLTSRYARAARLPERGIVYVSIVILAVLVLIWIILAYEHQICLLLLEWLQAHVERRCKTQARILRFFRTAQS